MSIRGQLIAQQQQQQQQHSSHSPLPPTQQAPQSPLSEQMQHQQHQQQLVNSQLNSSFKLQSNGSGNGMVLMQKSVAIVTPQRSNSMDYLNFEERRQLIASSLSLSEILSGQGGAPAKESSAVNDAGLGKWVSFSRGQCKPPGFEFKFTRIMCGTHTPAIGRLKVKVKYAAPFE